MIKQSCKKQEKKKKKKGSKSRKVYTHIYLTTPCFYNCISTHPTKSNQPKKRRKKEKRGYIQREYICRNI